MGWLNIPTAPFSGNARATPGGFCCCRGRRCFLGRLTNVHARREEVPKVGLRRPGLRAGV
jgi:hypothetical protein